VALVAAAVPIAVVVAAVLEDHRAWGGVTTGGTRVVRTAAEGAVGTVAAAAVIGTLGSLRGCRALAHLMSLLPHHQVRVIGGRVGVGGLGVLVYWWHILTLSALTHA
jgi:uncharacterized protein YjeT (DUF2065 family)